MFPLVGLPPLSVDQDSSVTRQLLESAESGASIHLATGYFNLTDDYVTSILNHSKASFHLLMAHPTVNYHISLSCLNIT